jgi:hypothetical protein
MAVLVLIGNLLELFMLVVAVEPQNLGKLPAQAVMAAVETEKQVLELLMEMVRQTEAVEVVV